MHLTKTEQRLFNLMSDGLPHTHAEMRALLPSEMSDTINQHLFSLRRKIKAEKLFIACDRVVTYTLVTPRNGQN